MTEAVPVLVLMGVSGAGKTTVGEALAKRLGWPYEEGDSLHPPTNIAKMKAGHALDDADRAPWLKAVGAWIDARLAAGGGGVISCSALKLAYRRELTDGRPRVKIVYLKGSEAEIAERVAHRHGHFMPPALLDSQFADLEPPSPDEGAIAVDIDQGVSAQVEEIVRALASPPAVPSRA